MDIAVFIAGFFDSLGNFLMLFLDNLVSVLPDTPSSLILGNLYSNLGSAIPFVGSGIIAELFNFIISSMSVIALIKAWKLLPFV